MSQLITKWNERYDKKRIPDWGLDCSPNEPFCELVIEQSSSNSRILEIGAGLGYNSIYISSKGRNITATDISINAVNRCKGLSQQRRVDIECYVLDVLKLPKQELGQYDLVYDIGCFHTFFSVTDRIRFAKAMASLLKNNKQALWLCSCGSADYNDFNDPLRSTYPRLTLREITEAIEPLFEVNQVRKGSYGKSAALDFTTWECVFKKR